MTSDQKKRAERRQVLKMFGGIGALALMNCGGIEMGSDAGTGGGGGSTGGGGGTAATGGGTAATGGGTAATGGGTAATGGGGGTSGAWATGGTSILSGADYGNPFSGGIGSTCTVYKSSTGGPCHATSPLLTRKDVSEGYAGLPMRLELLVVDTSCTPVPNVTVEIWMCDTKGVYSGDIDGNNDAFCTGGSAAAAAALWGRGIQTSGADGRVTFDANFPGWYSGRATHIHFKISVGSQAYLTSQLFFDDAFKSAIYNAQPNYVPISGQGYVPNTTDMVIRESGLAIADAVCSTAQQNDGALLAWKAITVS